MDVKEIEPFLLDKLLQHARPIADARTENRADMRLRDAGPFFFALEAFTLYSRNRLEETLLTLLDEFARLEATAYDELYLFSLVHLTQNDPRHAVTFWPLVLALDLRYRAAVWQRPADMAIVDQPYQLTELLLYYYVLFTLMRRPGGLRRYPSLAYCLRLVIDHVTAEQRALLLQTLLDLGHSERRPDFGDARGLLLKRE